MAANDFTPTGDSPRESDDSVGIKDALTAALAAHEASADDSGDEVIESPAGGAAVEPPAAKKDEAPAGETKETPAGDEKVAEPPKEGDKVEAEQKKAAEESKSTEPPAHWSAKDKETFKTLPDPAKGFLLDRHRSLEADYTRKTQELANVRKDYEAVDQIFTPQRDNLKKAGLTASQVIQGWANAELALQSGKGLEIIPGIAKAYRVDPIQLATQILVVSGVADPKAALEQAAAAAVEHHKNAPAPIVLPPEVQQKLARFDQIATHVETQTRQQVEAETNRINGELDKFKTATDAAGALLHPHFDELIEDMARLVDQATAANRPVPPVDQLYQDAIFANPAVRQKWLDAKLAAERSTTEAAQQAAREKAAAEAKARSEKARKAGSSVTGSTGPGQSLNGRRESGSLRSTIASAVEDSETVVH